MDSSKVHITEHDGKMEGIRSISTNTRMNEGCRKNAAIKGSICSKCYAESLLKLRKDLDANLENNHRLLTARVLGEDELPKIEDEIFRFESFGDLNNEIQLENYINITKKNPGTRFTLWTKRYELAYDYFRRHEVPSNFTLILSSLMINVKMNLDKFKDLGKFKKGQLKSFTVYDKDYIKAHWDSLVINCGSRCCNKCRQCYEETVVEEIGEILKSDQEKITVYENFHDEARMAEFGEMLDSLDI